jgi:hypothetical protein
MFQQTNQSIVYRDYHPRDYPAESRVTRAAKFIGKQEDEVIRELGEPRYRSAISGEQLGYGPRAELWNWYPQEYPANQAVVIHELSWVRGDVTTVIWFHNINGHWLYLNSIEFDDTVHF